MFSNPIILTPPVVSAPVNFAFAGATNDSSVYRVAPETGGFATIAKPATLKIAHQVSKVGTPGQTRRTVVRIDQTVGDESAGNLAVLSAYMVLVLPERVATVDQTTDILDMLRQFLAASGNQVKIVNREL